MAGPHRIDVHHHIWPPRWLKAEEESGRMAGRTPSWAAVSKWTPSMSLDAMGKNDVATTVTSVSTVVVHPDDPDFDHGFARDCNEFGATLARDNPGRIGTFALLPLPHVDRCLKEIEYAAGPLRADGFKLQTSYNDKWLGDPSFAPVWDELNRRKATVFVHPVVPDRCAGMIPGLSEALMEYPFDTTRAIASLLWYGTLQRCPDVKLIFAHGGGTFPFLASRISGMERSGPEIAAHLAGGIQAAVRNLYFEVCSATNQWTWPTLTAFVDPSHLLYGTDVPYGTFEKTTRELSEMGLSAEQVRAVERDNALAILPSLAR